MLEKMQTFLTKIMCYVDTPKLIGASAILVILLCAISYIVNIILRNKRKKLNPNLWQYLDTYLKMRKPGFAVYINGAWGSGKTYFIRHYLAPHNLFKMPCYLSLFGINSKEEFDFRMWKAVLFSRKKFAVLLAITILGIAIIVGFMLNQYSALKKLEFWSFTIPIVLGMILFLWKFVHLFIRDLMLKFRYLVLDDFERAEVDYSLLTAWISELVEHRCCPVIIVGNEQEIIKKLNSNSNMGAFADNGPSEHSASQAGSPACTHYKRIKEKVIGKELTLTQNDEYIIAALANKLSRISGLRLILLKSTKWFASMLFEPLHKNDVATNYRALEHVMYHFEWHFAGLKKYVTNEKIWGMLLPRYFSLMYFKELQELPVCGSFDSDKILNAYTLLSSDEKTISCFFTLYPFWTNRFLPLNLWRQILSNNPICKDEFQSFFDDYLHPDAVSIFKWSHVYKLDDDSLDELVNTTKSDLENDNVHLSPEEILMLTNAALNFQYLVPQYNGLNNFKEIVLRYILEEKNSVEFATCVTDYMTSINTQANISTMNAARPEIQKDYDEIQNAVVEAMEFSRSLIHEKVFTELTTRIAGEDSNFNVWFEENNLRFIDVFSGNDPQKLWDQLKDITTRLFDERLDLLRSHIHSIVSKNSNPEIRFWEAFAKYADLTRDLWQQQGKNYCKQFKIQQFLEMTHSKLSANNGQ